jgi:hypothetical protein
MEKLIPALLFCFVPFIIGFTTRSWFWRYHLFAALRQRARSFDQEAVTIEKTPIQISSLRIQDNIGDKIVLIHHLVPLANRIIDQIVERLVFGGILFALIVFIAALGEAQSPAASGGAGPKPAPTAGGGLLTSFTHFYYAPLGAITSIIVIFISVWEFYRNVSPYRDLLQRP